VLWLAGLVLAAGCGSDDESTANPATTVVSAGEVETALEAQLAQGGTGIVHLETDQPKQITCVKDAGKPSGWRCTVKPSKGESYVCFVEVDPKTKQTTKVTCGRIDN
jgi:hypothetical protein